MKQCDFKFDFKGVGVALVTPFNRDYSIDFNAIDALVESIIEGGCDYIVALGTTGETPTLSDEERKMVVRKVVDRVAGRVPVVLGCGGNNTMEVVNFLKSEDLSDFAAILSVVPPYNKPSQEGLYRHFSAIAEASPIPVLLYNVPGRTGTNLLPATVLRIARDHANVVGIKEASGNLDQAAAILASCPEGFKVISGDDSLTLSMMALGASGVISVVANALPAQWAQCIHLAGSGDFDKAGKILLGLLDTIHLLFADGNPAGIKALLAIQGKIKNVLRLPLVPVSGNVEEALRKLQQK